MPTIRAGHLLVVGSLLLTAMAGCSFRMPSHVTGSITALSVGATYEPFFARTPITFKAQATYGGGFKEPALSVVLPTDTSQTIRVQAVAQWAEPFLGLGVFVVPSTSTQSVEVKATITLERAGRYTLESVPSEDATVVRTDFDIAGE